MSEYIIDWDENLVIDTFSKNSLREEIVRCRDCEKLNTVDCPCAWYPLDKTSIMDGLNGFCSWGERMGVEDDR